MNLSDAATLHQLMLEAEGTSLKTQRNYGFYWKKLIAFCEESGLGDSVEQFSPDLIRQAAIWYRNRAGGRRGGQVGGRQFVQRMNTIGAMLIREGIIRESAYRSLKLPRVAKLLRAPFTQTEIAAMWGAAQNSRNPERDEALLLLLLDTGMRIGEAATLEVDKLDLAARQLIIGELGKGRRERIVPIGDDAHRDGGRTVRALKKYLVVRPESRYARGRIFSSARWAARHR
jgi:site-specific recombinase XerC